MSIEGKFGIIEDDYFKLKDVNNVAGHSKWNNINQRKGAQDKKRAKQFQKFTKHIYKAAKEGGDDPDTNPALRLAIDKARDGNMPNDNIERAIKRATDPNEGANYNEVTYEGYGPAGVGIYVEALSDNLNRTATNVRLCFDRNGGNLGEKGSVSYMFERKGYIVIEREGLDMDEDDMLMAVIEAGGEELEASEEIFEIYTEGTDFAEVRDALEEDYELATKELIMKPNIEVPISDEEKEQLNKILEALEEDDDVDEVYHNAQV